MLETGRAYFEASVYFGRSRSDNADEAVHDGETGEKCSRDVLTT